MERKSKKLYEKAMKLYEQGKIDKALDICDSALSEELNNSSILNFKGLLLYQKGKLNEAITVWKINKKFNNDAISENYINDSKNDFERLELYRDGEKALKKLNIELALELFSRCALSDFNSIRVNIGLAICYQKKGDYNKALEYIQKALKIDSINEEAIKVKKELLDFGGYKIKKKSSKKSLMVLTFLFTIILFIGGSIALFMRHNYESLFNNANVNAENIEHNSNTDNIDLSNKNDEEEIKGEETIKTNEKINDEEKEKKVDETDKKIVGFDNKKIEELIGNRNIDGLVDELKMIKKDDISTENIYLYRQAIELINTEGVVNYYNKGLTYYNEKNYENAEIEFDKAYAFCENNAYKEHIIFYRASNLSQLMKNDLAIKQYEEYYEQYPNGVYREGVLYELVLLNSSIDKEKSKKYANELVNSFPQSIYINDYIINILNN